jgi:hypothetical protein
MPRLLRVSILTVLLVPGCASLGYSPQDKQGDAASQQKAPGDQIAPTPTANPAPNKAPSDASTGNRDDQQRQTNWGSIADWASVLVTFAGVCGALWSLRLISQQTKAAVDAATAARDAADVAKADVALAMKAQRAFIGVVRKTSTKMLRASGVSLKLN